MTIRPKALLDTNVLVAALERKHEHHGPSVAMFDRARDGELAVAAHAIAETYSTLTRAGGMFRWLPDEAWQGIASVMKVTTLVGLSPAAQLDAVRIFAEKHGIGPRIYDYLIGEAAVQNGIDRIITWNTSHMRSLFPKLRVTAPTDVDRP
jgi:predicted nucleic acid-binding protein